MPRFRRRPVIVEAVQVWEDQYIDTLEGRMHASPGDWIVTGVNGERWPVKPDIFARTYEAVGDAEGVSADHPCDGECCCCGCP
jgi:hypothetical protein